MKKLIILIWMTLAPICVWAKYVVIGEPFEVNGLYYQPLKGRKPLVALVAAPNDRYRALDTLRIPASVTYAATTYRVVRIDDQALRGCCFLRYIQMPDGIEEIGFQALMNCIQLTDITWPARLRWMDEMVCYGCSSLQQVTVGPRLKEWGDMCYSDCTRMRRIAYTGRRAPRARRMTFFGVDTSLIDTHKSVPEHKKSKK